MNSNRKLIDANALYEQIAKKEELARQRVLDTPSRMPNGDLNPSAIRYHTQLDERTQMKFMIADAPTIDAEPVKHSKWIETDEYDEFYGRLYRCSNCNTFVIGDMDNYCSYCGARMVTERE